MPQPIPESARALFDATNLAVVTTLMPDGVPQTTPVWIDIEDGTAVFNTAKGRTKERNLARDPRIALCVVSSEDPYEYVELRGRAEFDDEGAVDHIHALSRKYTGEPFSLPAGQERVKVRIIADVAEHRRA